MWISVISDSLGEFPWNFSHSILTNELPKLTISLSVKNSLHVWTMNMVNELKSSYLKSILFTISSSYFFLNWMFTFYRAHFLYVFLHRSVTSSICLNKVDSIMQLSRGYRHSENEQKFVKCATNSWNRQKNCKICTRFVKLVENS